ncbi:MAG: UDP-glucose 4-epimerase GalE [Ignavibacteria bacterium]|nr:UDP-glucose 4-epimerase GalE [Ignavibacteria bacterium]
MILVTGGAGYIGSHTVRFLLKNGFEVAVLDNLSRGHIESVPQNVRFEKIDLLDYNGLLKAFKKYKIEAVIHFAAFAYVGESVGNPGLYYRNNVIGSFNLIDAAQKNGVEKFVFSSTCSVYGNPVILPIPEEHKLEPLNPYARTKLAIEGILSDYGNSYGMKYVSLRYFNAAGASENMEIGESHDPEPHLIPLVLFTVLDRKEKVSVYGNDYPTKDGTCIRDYVHVNDLADAHVKALNFLNDGMPSDVFNIGTGKGHSVKEIIDIAEKITGRKIKYEITDRRPGDPGVLIADNTGAKIKLGWSPKYDIEYIIESAYKWHNNQKF